MKKGINDIILDKIIDLDTKAAKKAAEILKGERPFSSKELDPDMFIWAVDNLGFEDMAELRQMYTDDAINKMIYDAHVIRQRRGYG